jgi:CTP-dependent riboflavin kinase
MIHDTRELKLKIIESGYKAVQHLIEVAEEKIVQKNVDSDGEITELAADRLKNAAATKKLAIFDAFEILNRIELERESLDAIDKGLSKVDTKQGFAERRSR